MIYTFISKYPNSITCYYISHNIACYIICIFMYFNPFYLMDSRENNILV